MATVRFRVLTRTDNAQIYIRFSINRENVFQIKTGKILNYKDWSVKNSLPLDKTPELKNLKSELKELEIFILNSYNDAFSQGKTFSKDWLKDKLDLFFNRIDEKMDDTIFLNYLNNFNEYRELDSKTKKTTNQKFINLWGKFSDFEKEKKKIYTIPEIDRIVFTQFKNFLMTQCNLMESTAQRTLKNLKTVLLDARDNEKNVNHQVNVLTFQSIPSIKVFLTPNEINKIKNTLIIGKDLEYTKDWLLIGCYTGQRVSDLLRMDKTMIYVRTDSEGESYRFIELIQEKTGNHVSIPIHDEVENILNKYDGNFPPVFSVKKGSNDALFNRYLKKVCEIAGLNQIVKGKVFNEELKKNEIKETEKYHLVSSHICRRSFATNHYGDKRYTTPQIMAITGHKTESVFLSYIGKTSSDHAMETAKTYKQISEEKKNIVNI